MIDFIILCGGYGTRFQEISKTIPKILIEIKPGISMLDWLVQEYLPYGCNCILATGHLHNSVVEHINKAAYKSNILFSHEEERLGTAGAIIKASRLVKTNDFIVLNGDTIQKLKVSQFQKDSILLDNDVINVGCTRFNSNDSGKILVDSKGVIINFSEKKDPNMSRKFNYQTYSSLGMYRCLTSFFQKQDISLLSLEEQLLPLLVRSRIARASIFSDEYHDFGTFDRYNQLKEII